MSGRLTILPKKTYCPWKPENVERVLRDERLERERLEREKRRSSSSILDDHDYDRRRPRRRRAGGDDDDYGGRGGGCDGGHINLFPEAREADLNLARGVGVVGPARTSSSLPDAPLGGDEAARRKSGLVPFYMRVVVDAGRRNEKNGTNDDDASSRAGNVGAVGKYDEGGVLSSSFRLGRRLGRAGGAEADAITSAITMDQYARREDDRKGRMDPMRSFVVGSSSGRSPTGEKSDWIAFDRTIRRDDDDDGSDTDIDRRMGRKRGREEGGMEDESRRWEKERNRSSDERHGRRRSRGGHSMESEDCRPRSRSRSRRHGSYASRDDNAVHDDGIVINDGRRFRSSGVDELEELRKRRHAREAREMERERRVIFPQQSVTNVHLHGNDSREGKYQDQFNPTLSRN
jgi:hypothetical protein